MAAYNDATLRQQEILDQLGKKLGFNVNNITSVTYTSDIPTQVSYADSQGTVTRSIAGSDLGGIITDYEVQNLKIYRSETQVMPARPTARTNSGNFSNNNTTANIQPSTRTTTNLSNSAETRLAASGLSAGAIFSTISNVLDIFRFPSIAKDMRVKISDPSGRISYSGGALAALANTDYKVVFPYTPEISVSHNANYSGQTPTHSNYEYLFYQNSTVSDITINATFSATSPQDADYVLAVQHFFRSVTKMFSGQDSLAGLPPVVCRLEGHGDLQFSYVPIVITGFTSTLPSDVDYISSSNPSAGRVPTMQTMSITAKPIYSRNKITNDFSLDRFSNGSLLGNPNTGQGGFI